MTKAQVYNPALETTAQQFARLNTLDILIVKEMQTTTESKRTYYYKVLGRALIHVRREKAILSRQTYGGPKRPEEGPSLKWDYGLQRAVPDTKG